jgi:peptide/nickel transport system substrate-binding protein
MTIVKEQRVTERAVGWLKRQPRSMSRRAFVGRAVVAGVSLPSAATLLAACGGEDDAATATIAATPQSTAATAPVASTPAGATPTSSTLLATATTAAEPTSEPEPTPTNPAAAEINPHHYGKPIKPAVHQGGTLVIAATSDLSNPDFFWGGNLWGVTETLLEQHPDSGEPSPLLAEAWEVSDDGVIWTFSIRQGITWHDGEPFGPADVVYSYGLTALGAYYGPTMFERIETIETPDDWTVRFVLNEGTPQFATESTVFGILAEHVVAPLGYSDEELSAPNVLPIGSGLEPALVVGTGPFKLQEVIVGEQATLVRHDDYWDGAPHLDQIIWKVVLDSGALTTQLSSGTVDLAGLSYYAQLNSAVAAELTGGSIQVVDFPTENFTALGFLLDAEKAPALADVQVRQALLWATDRAACVEAIEFGFAEVAPALQAPHLIDQNDLTVHYGYDPERAMALLDEAGWLPGPSEVRERDGQPLTFSLLIDGGNATHQSYAAVLQEQWRAVGVALTIESETRPVYGERFFAEAHDYQAVLTSDYSLGIDIGWVFSCAGGPAGNNFMYCNPEVDALLDEGLNTFDPEVRQARFSQAQNILMTELPMAPLVVLRGVAAINPRVHNVHPAAFSSVCRSFFNLETWWVEPA